MSSRVAHGQLAATRHRFEGRHSWLLHLAQEVHGLPRLAKATLAQNNVGLTLSREEEWSAVGTACGRRDVQAVHQRVGPQFLGTTGEVGVQTPRGRFGHAGGRLSALKYENGTHQVERYVDGGKPRRKNFPSLAIAKAWARTWYEAGQTVTSDLTLRQLFDRFFQVVPAQRNHRGATILNASAHRKRVEEALGPDFRVNRLTLAHLDTLWEQLLGAGIAPNQVRQKLKLLQRVLAWGHSRELVSHAKAAGWQVPEVKSMVIQEYQPHETEAILAQWDYQRSGDQWRTWALVMITSTHGFRINALLNLRWDDVDLEAGVIRMREETDKTKVAWERPMTFEAYSALLTARAQADRREAVSPFVFPGRDPARHYTYAAAIDALHKAGERAGVEQVKYRGFHGFRRQAVNDARQATGDAALGLLWVNDRDLRQSKRYVRERVEELAALANRTPTIPTKAAPRSGAGGAEQ